MIKINCPDSDRIANEYYKRLKAWLQCGTNKSKLGKPKKTTKHKTMLDFFEAHIQDIICNNYPDIKYWQSNFEKTYNVDIKNYKGTLNKHQSKTKYGKFKKKMASLFDNFMKAKGVDGKTNGVWLTQRLGIKTCPYCNRQYTFTIDKNAKHMSIRPQLDHFLPKSKYPLLALSFYNLIPACPECNRIKRDEVLDIYPYNDDFDSNGLKFRIDMKDNSDKIVVTALDTSDFKIVIENGNKNKNVMRLGLTKLYNEHKDYVAEIIRKCQAYNNNYYDTLIHTYKGLNMSESDIHRMIWGAYIDDGEQGRRPLSKLTKDIMAQLNVKL